ncbi:MAG: DinB family protein [Ardenticatenaceae bacterium]|nr:DinB family protein [Ardenticatenaceae bacterium]
MTHPLVAQLHFARREFARCLAGISDEDACRRLLPMNCISWMIGHLATQEQFYWVYFAQGKLVRPHLYELVGHGRPASSPPLEEMWQAWQEITAAADEFLETITPELMTTYLTQGEERSRETVGTMLQRNTYHYWFHTGEAHAVRQRLGHGDLPEFVGDMSTAVYRPS